MLSLQSMLTPEMLAGMGWQPGEQAAVPSHALPVVSVSALLDGSSLPRCVSLLQWLLKSAPFSPPPPGLWRWQMTSGWKCSARHIHTHN